LTHVIEPTLIDQIVVEVLSQLRQRINSARDSSSTKGVSSPAPTLSLTPIELLDAVITEETLKQRADAGGSIRVLATAILTPSARDYINTHQIALHRHERNEHAGASSSLKPGTIIAAYLPEVARSLIAVLNKPSWSSWAVEMESGVEQVVDRARSVICRGEFQQALVFVKQPHKVACLVNRNSNCRAAVVNSGAEVRRARTEFAANVICVNLQQPTFMGLREIVRTCAETVDLAQEAAGSGG
jgi:hypothetical protein